MLKQGSIGVWAISSMINSLNASENLLYGWERLRVCLWKGLIGGSGWGKVIMND